MAKDIEAEALERAIAYLGAVEVAPGRYAFPARTITRQPQNTITYEAWHVADKCALIKIIVHAAALSTVGAVPMPAWWSPEQRFRSEPCESNHCAGHRFTADLETGAEVLA
jgi:hypothetical protein